MTQPQITVLLLAAGHASRMRGGDKTLEPVAGVPLLVHMTREILAAGCACTVTVPSTDHPRSRALSVFGAEERAGLLQRIPVPDRDLGMSASIRRGVAALSPSCEGVMLQPADMPELDQSDFETLRQRFEGVEGAIVRASSSDGRPGHPVLFPRRCFADLMELSGDTGARTLLRRETVTLCPLPGIRALTDLDSPEDWSAWRQTRS